MIVPVLEQLLGIPSVYVLGDEVKPETSSC